MQNADPVIAAKRQGKFQLPKAMRDWLWALDRAFVAEARYQTLVAGGTDRPKASAEALAVLSATVPTVGETDYGDADRVRRVVDGHSMERGQPLPPDIDHAIGPHRFHIKTMTQADLIMLHDINFSHASKASPPAWRNVAAVLALLIFTILAFGRIASFSNPSVADESGDHSTFAVQPQSP